ncbi:MAG: hypothetical protein C5B58_02970 [Acidobacteria bacterium]|nr:MAG: hypothetical protein C5B58_02970 [Acidobacteriota bacterium]
MSTDVFGNVTALDYLITNFQGAGTEFFSPIFQISNGTAQRFVCTDVEFIPGDGSGCAAAYFDVASGSSGPLTASPLPTTLPLFATGLGALGLLGRRRKRKIQ